MYIHNLQQILMHARNWASGQVAPRWLLVMPSSFALVLYQQPSPVYFPVYTDYPGYNTKLYDSDSCPTRLQSQSPRPGVWGESQELRGRLFLVNLPSMSCYMYMMPALQFLAPQLLCVIWYVCYRGSRHIYIQVQVCVFLPNNLCIVSTMMHCHVG